MADNETYIGLRRVVRLVQGNQDSYKEVVALLYENVLEAGRTLLRGIHINE
jgi:hypothetical protein